MHVTVASQLQVRDLKNARMLALMFVPVASFRFTHLLSHNSNWLDHHLRSDHTNKQSDHSAVCRKFGKICGQTCLASLTCFTTGASAACVRGTEKSTTVERAVKGTAAVE